MYPSRDDNPIAIEHWQRERLTKDIAFVDAAAARDGSARRHELVQHLRQFFCGEWVARRRREASETMSPADHQGGPSL